MRKIASQIPQQTSQAKLEKAPEVTAKETKKVSTSQRAATGQLEKDRFDKDFRQSKIIEQNGPLPQGAAPARSQQGLSSSRSSLLRLEMAQLQQNKTSSSPAIVGEASTLLSEEIHDGRVNCLERAYHLAAPQDSVTLLHDQRDPVGHAVVERADGQVIDPNQPEQSYASLEEYLGQNPHYATMSAPEARQIPQESLQSILETPPNSEARAEALAKANLGEVGQIQVADSIYTVEDGDTLWGIAATHGLSVSALKEANNLGESDMIRPGDRLVIPDGNGPSNPSPSNPSPSNPPASGSTYTVQDGDTLWGIAASNGVTVSALKEANNMGESDMIRAGDSLVIPGSNSSPSPAPSPTTPVEPPVNPTPPGSMTTQEITQIQQQLQDYGYYDPSQGQGLGHWDGDTQQALAAFQSWHGLAVTGEMNEQTRELLARPPEKTSSGHAKMVGGVSLAGMSESEKFAYLKGVIEANNPDGVPFNDEPGAINVVFLRGFDAGEECAVENGANRYNDTAYLLINGEEGQPDQVMPLTASADYGHLKTLFGGHFGYTGSSGQVFVGEEGEKTAGGLNAIGLVAAGQTVPYLVGKHVGSEDRGLGLIENPRHYFDVSPDYNRNGQVDANEGRVTSPSYINVHQGNASESEVGRFSAGCFTFPTTGAYQQFTEAILRSGQVQGYMEAYGLSEDDVFAGDEIRNAPYDSQHPEITGQPSTYWGPDASWPGVQHHASLPNVTINVTIADSRTLPPRP